MIQKLGFIRIQQKGNKVSLYDRRHDSIDKEVNFFIQHNDLF